MGRASVAFAVGALFCHQLTWLPDPLLVGMAPLLLALLRCRGSVVPTAVFILGMAWTQLHGQLALDRRLPPQLQGKDLSLTVRIVGLPVAGTRSVRFQASVVQGPGSGPWRASGCLLRLTRYFTDVTFRPGERWRLMLRLRIPGGTRNAGDWDREHRALREGVCAVGYVRPWPVPQRVAPAPAWSWHALRARLAHRVTSAVGQHPGGGLIMALTLGERSAITPEQRALLHATATAHLVAISGLHVGMVAGVCMLLATTLARGSPILCRAWTARSVGVMFALPGAFLYAALAGFTLPTQRALVMLAVLCLAAACRRRGTALAGLPVALLVVLLLDPLSALGVDLWLSFTATLALVVGLSRSPGGAGSTLAQRVRRALLGLGHVQLTAGLALMPLSLLVFGHQAWLAPLYNAVAVPVAGAVVVPLALLGLCLDAAHLWPGELLLQLAARVASILLQVLEVLLRFEPHWRSGGALHPLAALSATLGVALVLRALNRAWLPLAVALCLPALFPPVPRPGEGELWLDVMDVGQGLATIVQTSQHTLVYDTGPPFAGARVLSRALMGRAVAQVDVLLVSHGDADHSGGAAGLLDAVPVMIRIGNTPALPGPRHACHVVSPWDWDGYRFQMLHPPRPRGGNDGSCVLRIAGPGGSVLLPGDIEAAAEARLVRRAGPALRSQVLVVPHHGSRSSSTAQFLQQVRPRMAIVASGYRNRYGFPHGEVLERYRRRGISIHDTACVGGVRVILSPFRSPQVRSWWPGSRRFWHVVHGLGHCSKPDTP